MLVHLFPQVCKFLTVSYQSPWAFVMRFTSLVRSKTFKTMSLGLTTLRSAPFFVVSSEFVRVVGML